MNNAYLIVASVLVITVVYFALAMGFGGVVACGDQVMNYYFRSDCSHCQRVEADGSLEKLEELGVQVNKFEVLQWGMYGIYATPTFEINGQQHAGYMTLGELKSLLGC